MQPLYTQFQPMQTFMTPVQVKAHKEKDLTILTISLYLGIALIVINAIFMCVFVSYVITYKNSSGIPGFLQGTIYIALITNVVFGVGIYFVASSDAKTYEEIMNAIPIVITGFMILHVSIIMALTVIIIVTPGHEYLILYIGLPCLLDIAVIVIETYLLSNLFKEVKYFPIPLT